MSVQKFLLAVSMFLVVFVVCNFFFFLGAVKNTHDRVLIDYQSSLTNIVNINTLYFKRLINDTGDMNAFLDRFKLVKGVGDVDSCYIYTKAENAITIISGEYNPHIYEPSAKLCIKDPSREVYFDYLSQDFYLFQVIEYNSQYGEPSIGNSVEQGILIFYKVDFTKFFVFKDMNVKYRGMYIGDSKDIGRSIDIRIGKTKLVLEIPISTVMWSNKDMMLTANTISLIVVIIILMIMWVSLKIYYITIGNELKVIASQIDMMAQDFPENIVCGDNCIKVEHVKLTKNEQLLKPILVSTNMLIKNYMTNTNRITDFMAKTITEHNETLKLIKLQSAKTFSQGYKDAIPDISIKLVNYDIQSYVYPLDSGAGDVTFAFESGDSIIGAVFDISGHGSYTSLMAAKVYNKIMEEKVYGINSIQELAKVFLMHRNLLNDQEDTIDMCLFELNTVTNKITFLFFSQLFIVAKFKNEVMVYKDESITDYRKLNIYNLDKLRRHSDIMYLDELEYLDSIVFEWYDMVPGDTVIIVTDGFFEKYTNSHGIPIGKKKLTEILVPFMGASCNDIINGIEEPLAEACDNNRDGDDRTICVIKRLDRRTRDRSSQQSKY